VPPLDPVWAGLRLIPLAILAPSNGVSWLVDREWSSVIGCGWLGRVVHGWVSPMFGLSLGISDLWMCTSSTELEIHLNVVWISHVDSEYGDRSFYLWSLRSFEYILTVDIIVVFFITYCDAFI
jgi:hypothetical protein